MVTHLQEAEPFDGILKQARKALFIDHDAQTALQLLETLFGPTPAQLPTYLYQDGCELTGYLYYGLQDFRQAYDWFYSAQNHYMSGYCCMLSGDLTNAHRNWLNLGNIRENHWAFTLHGLINNSLETVPTFIQLRNHLEADVMNLLINHQQHLAFNIVSHIDDLGLINLESYKYIGRALMHTGYLDQARLYLEEGQKKLPADVEAYFHLGQCYSQLGARDEAVQSLERCLSMAKVYVPAQDLLNQLQ